MPDRDLARRLDAAYARLVDQTDQVVETPSVESIHRRVGIRGLVGVVATFAATTVAGLLVGSLVFGIDGRGLRSQPPVGPAGPVAGAPTPAVSRTRARTVSPTPVPRPTHTMPGPTVRQEMGTVRPDPRPTTSLPPQGTTPTASAASPAASSFPPPSGTAPPGPTATASPSNPPSPSPSSEMAATAVPRPPVRVWLGYRSGRLDDRVCRQTRRVERTVADPTPRVVVAAVVAGPTPAERADGVRSVYGRDGSATPVVVSADWSRRVVTVDFPAPGAIALAPAACRATEVSGPVVDALRQSHPQWTVRFTLQGSAERFTAYVKGG